MSCKVFLCFEDGDRYELSQVTYKQFRDEYDYEGASDLEYEKWLRDNNLYELSDFDLSTVGMYYWVEVVYD